ncbi:tetratricopeptide repeat protein [Crenobacter sp. SG2303]|uniref:Tetratricopeptide repeat protein n=1 Tax=Crenobacter oryzisoli TaxID=3056844 RepID=A0ABT7XUI4_9NEIS|nr:tetratricopeptide repeat protein [Crenobacter sp. SG2303]MDN0077462.1 tetratricopeptide repeat protein [Crenobacter sp. SG2303]
MNEQLAHTKLNRAIQQLGAGQPAQARATLQPVLKAYPDSPQLHLLMGLALVKLAQDDGALRHFGQAIALEPRMAEAYVNRGIMLKNRGRLDEALADLDRAIALHPNLAEAYYNRGNVRLALNQMQAARDDFATAVRLNPHYADALANLGELLARDGAFAEAFPLLRQAVVLQADRPEFHDSLGNALSGLSRHEEAIAAYRTALQLNPSQPDVLAHLGNALAECEHYDEARQCFDLLLQAQPRHAQGLNAKSHMMAALGRYDEARALLEQALAIQPDFALAQFNLALLLLRQGDYVAGWRHYEARRLDPATRRSCALREFSQPEWQGEDLAGKTLLLHQEQGLGDTLQMLRYLPILADRGARLVLLVTPAVAALAASLGTSVEIVTDAEALPPFDLHCPLMSLPLWLATTLDSIPAAQGYLSVDAERQQQWAEHLGPRSKPRIGLAWSGSRHHSNDRRRSLPLGALAELLSLDVEFHSLQLDYRETPEEIAAQGIRDHAALLHSLADTAALIAQLDAVISVDTSVAHLAAALGKPCWLLLPAHPDFRWGLTGDTSPWYGSMTLFRQGDDRQWPPVVDALRRHAEDWLGSQPG